MASNKTYAVLRAQPLYVYGKRVRALLLAGAKIDTAKWGVIVKVGDYALSDRKIRAQLRCGLTKRHRSGRLGQERAGTHRASIPLPKHRSSRVLSRCVLKRPLPAEPTRFCDTGLCIRRICQF